MIEKLSDHHVVSDHSVVIETLTRESTLVVSSVGKEVHSRGVVPKEKGLTLVNRTSHEIECGKLKLPIDRFHALTSQRTGIDDVSICEAVNHAARRKELNE